MASEEAPAGVGPVTAEQILEAMRAQQQTLNRLMDHIAAQTHTGGGGNSGGGGGKLVAKYFQCPQFTGKAESWSDFAFRFKRATRSQSPEAHDLPLRAERDSAEYDQCHDDSDYPLLSGPMYDVLSSRLCRRATDSRRGTSCAANTTPRRFHVDSSY